MKTLEDKITESGCEALKGMIKVLQDNGFEVTVKNTEPIDDLLPEFTSYQEVFDKLSSLGEWEEVDPNSEQYHLVFEGTQGLNPLTWGKTLDYHYAEYNFNAMCYRLRWKVGSLGNNNNPIIEFKVK